MKILHRLATTLISLLLIGALLLCAAVSALIFLPALSGQKESGADIAELVKQLPLGRMTGDLLTELLESGTEISDEISGRIRSAASSGDYTDSSIVPLSENALFYPYYSMLDSTAQKAYSMIYECFLAHDETVYFGGIGLNGDRFQDIWQAVCNDHPELFWVSSECSYSTDLGGSVYSASFTYFSFPEGLDEAERRFQAAAEQILSQAAGLGSDYEKESFIYDALAELVVYDSESEYNQSAYSALVNGASVCAGYSRAFQYLMKECGIPCYYCMGDCDGDHAWNIVMLDGEYYNVDLTWDDAIGSHTFFNRSDADFSGTHERTGLSVYLPACSGETYRNNSAVPEECPPAFRSGPAPGQFSGGPGGTPSGGQGGPGFGGTPPGRGGFRP